MDIEYSLSFNLPKASSITITKSRDGRIEIIPNYITDEELNLIFATFNSIVTSRKIRHKEYVTK
jgi:hypothetical protein